MNRNFLRCIIIISFFIALSAGKIIESENKEANINSLRKNEISKASFNIWPSSYEVMNCGYQSKSGDLIEKSNKDIQNEFNIKFSLGCFEVPDILRLAIANFSVGYVIKIDEKGRPKRVSSFWSADIPNLRGTFDSEEVLSCIKMNWRFVGFEADSDITVLLRWEHPKGFETIIIYNDKFSYCMRLSPTIYEVKKY
jgi:hypothetical protein